MTDEVTFSVIIPVFHGGRFLREALASAVALDDSAGRFEVIVAGQQGDEGARRAVEEAAAGGARVCFVPCPTRNRSAMLNAAWRRARGRVLAFTDDDCVLPPGWLAALKAALEDAEAVGVVGGPDRHGGSRGAFDCALDWVLESFVARCGFRSGGSGAGKYYPRCWNMAVPGEVAHQVALRRNGAAPALFDESLEVHEDVELARRIEQSGRRIAFAPDAGVVHARDTTLGSLVRRNFGMARVSAGLGVHRFAHGVLAASLVGAAALATAAALYAPARTALAACAAAYVLALLGCALAAAVATRRMGVIPHVVLILAGLHVARGLGYLAGLGSGKLRRL